MGPVETVWLRARDSGLRNFFEKSTIIEEVVVLFCVIACSEI